MLYPPTTCSVTKGPLSVLIYRAYSISPYSSISTAVPLQHMEASFSAGAGGVDLLSFCFRSTSRKSSRTTSVSQLLWARNVSSAHTIEFVYSGTRLRNGVPDRVYSSSLVCPRNDERPGPKAGTTPYWSLHTSGLVLCRRRGEDFCLPIAYTTVGHA